MKTKSILFLICFCFVTMAHQLYAQGTLKFENETHDFGKVAQGVPVSYQFKFKNTGTAPVVISNVQASCGCTTPEWTNTPVLPGKSGFIKASYNAAAMGAFNKSITVTSNGTNGTQVLYIKGTVVDKAELKASLTPAQKAQSPRATLTKDAHNFGKLESGQKAVTKVTVKNTGKNDLVIEGIQSACNCITYKSLTPKIKPGTEGIVELTYIPRVLGDQTEVVKFSSNDVVSPELSFNLKAKVVQSLATQSVLKENSAAVPFK
ncbi:DUF1573 domain-containing protein [Adhaeribacter rhizoryzae]|uniref:DUF1573 domain-containing protein n=1 Tax=Adhaeribacter rhizoryzae TaxID=2607907 RepID=A0A5M6DB76_9BACT|nr:DUF1573 domain-containing protein [Adhaeribacter rhizoryzae]KAA5544814.1 DUF1573 domain-containing protein [Adhaeribacter rhizoryzae]